MQISIIHARKRGQTPEKDNAENFARIFRALERLEMWECFACREIYSNKSLAPFGMCEECLANNELAWDDLDPVKISDHDLAMAWSHYHRECSPFLVGEFRPYRQNWTPGLVPRPYYPLIVILSVFGLERIKQAVWKLDHRTAVLDWERLIWFNQYGFAPRSWEPPEHTVGGMEWRKAAQKSLAPYYHATRQPA